MYSITDEESLEHARYIGESVQRKKPDSSENIVLVGTKADLEHLRRVDFSSAQETANDLQCLFQEISISEGYEQVEKLFQELLRRYSKKSSQKAPVKSILKKKQKSKDNLSKGSLGRKKSMHNTVPIVE
jgi:GTPase SAR1 family protein